MIAPPRALAFSIFGIFPPPFSIEPPPRDYLPHPLGTFVVGISLFLDFFGYPPIFFTFLFLVVWFLFGGALWLSKRQGFGMSPGMLLPVFPSP